MLIVAATMKRELAGLRERLRGFESAHVFGQKPTDQLGWEIDFQVLGMGYAAAESLRSTLARYCAGQRARSIGGILMLGFAGAMDPSLAPGDLVSASTHYHSSGVHSSGVAHSQIAWNDEATTGPSKTMRQIADKAANAIGTTLKHAPSLTLDHLMTAVEEKQSSHHQTGSAIVNMEDYWLASLAHNAGVPFLSVRAVLDTAQEPLPAYLAGCLATSPTRVGLAALAKPWRIPSLVHLARRASQAETALTRFGLAFTEGWRRTAQSEAATPLAASEGVLL